MLEETGTVVKANEDWLWVETTPRSACSHCGAGSCTTSVVAKLFGTRRNQLRLPNSHGAQAGQQVVIGIPDQVLVAVSLRAYLLPLIAMIGATALAAMLRMSDLLQAFMALGGLFLGLSLMGLATQSGKARQRYAPKLLRTLGAPEPHIDITALSRSRS